jgi:hypothetical protein
VTTAAARLCALCAELDERGVPYNLAVMRDSLMLMVAVPDERWELEFFDDGHVELERFVSQGVQDAPSAPEALLRILDD